MNVPKLRFKGFEGEWAKSTLKNIVEINPKSEPLESKFKYIDLEAVSNGVLINSTIINKSSAPSRAQRVVLKNDILYQTVRPYQKNNLFVDFENKNLQVVASTGYAQIRTKDKIDSKWLYQLMNTSKFTQHVLLRCTGTSYPAINGSDLGEIEVKFPKLEEQQQIGLFFKKLDRKIQLQQEKIDLLQKQKKGFLQKMFPKAGETQPELRFKGEKYESHLEWQCLKLGTLTIKKGPKNKDGYGYPVASVNNSIGCIIEGNKNYSNAKVDISNYKIVNRNEFVYNPSRINVGSYGYQNLVDRAIVSSLYVVFKTKPELLNEYLKIYMETRIFNTEVQRNTEGSVREYLFYENFSNIKIPLPSLEEQRIIASFFEVLDNKIDLERNKLIHLKEQKEGFLQQMFV